MILLGNLIDAASTIGGSFYLLTHFIMRFAEL